MGQIEAEVLAVFIGLEIAVLLAPLGDGVHHALHKLRNTGLALGRPEFAMEILGGDDVGGGLRPVDGRLHIALLEDDVALIVADGGGAGFPLDLVVRGLAGFEP